MPLEKDIGDQIVSKLQELDKLFTELLQQVAKEVEDEEKS